MGVPTQYFIQKTKGNPHGPNDCSSLYDLPRFNRRQHRRPQRFQVFFQYLAESIFVCQQNKHKAALWIKVATRILITKQW